MDFVQKDISGFFFIGSDEIQIEAIGGILRRLLNGGNCLFSFLCLIGNRKDEGIILFLEIVLLVGFLVILQEGLKNAFVLTGLRGEFLDGKKQGVGNKKAVLLRFRKKRRCFLLFCLLWLFDFFLLGQECNDDHGMFFFIILHGKKIGEAFEEFSHLRIAIFLIVDFLFHTKCTDLRKGIFLSRSEIRFQKRLDSLLFLIGEKRLLFVFFCILLCFFFIIKRMKHDIGIFVVLLIGFEGQERQVFEQRL